MYYDTKNEAQSAIYYESHSSRLVYIKCPIKWTLKWKNIARIKNPTLTNSTQWNNLKIIMDYGKVKGNMRQGTLNHYTKKKEEKTPSNSKLGTSVTFLISLTWKIF